MIDADPVELSAEVLLHLPDQLTGEALEVAEIRRVLRRDDETEMMPIFLATLSECLGIGVFRLRTEQPRLLSVPGYAVAAQVAEMSAKRPARAVWRTMRALTVTSRVRPVRRRFAWTLATRPRPKVERPKLFSVPRRETPPPAR